MKYIPKNRFQQRIKWKWNPLKRIKSNYIIAFLCIWASLVLLYGYHIFNSSNPLTTSTKTPQTKSSLLHAENGVVMCVPKDHGALAYAQIKYFQNYLNGSSYDFQICHVSELNDIEKSLLKSLNNVHLVDLEPLLKSMKLIGKLSSQHNVSFFRGYPCKPMCLYFNNYENVVMMDIDIIIASNPFHMFNQMNSNQGLLLFHDVKHDPSDRLYKLTKEFIIPYIYSDSKPESFQTQLSKIQALAQYRHVGESAIVLLRRSLMNEMLQLLLRLHYKDIAFHIYQKQIMHGDKETYWIASILTNSNFMFSPWGWTPAGYKNKSRNGICSFRNCLAQYHPFKESELLYLNSDGIEEWILNSHIDYENQIKYVSYPVLYDDAPVIGKQVPFCSGLFQRKIPSHIYEGIGAMKGYVKEFQKTHGQKCCESHSFLHCLFKC